MIKSKSSSVDEFSPPDVRDWESQIRILVRVASIGILLLFVLKILENTLLEIYDELTLGVILILLGIFLLGLVIGFLQLRYINVKRNKLTNIGGLIGFSGLFLTAVPCSCDLVLEEVFPIIINFSSILNSLLLIGLLLTTLGFFLEVTQLDQILIYIVRFNFWKIIKYSVTGLGFFFVNLGVLVIFYWPRGINGFWAVGIGSALLLVTWYKEISTLLWDNKAHIIRTFELIFCEFLLLYMMLSALDSLLIQGHDYSLEVLFVSILFGTLSLTILYLDLYLFRVPTDYQRFSDQLLRRIFLLGFLLGVVLVLLGIFYPETALHSLNDMNVAFRTLHAGVGLLVVYRVFFKEINNFVNSTIQSFISMVRYLWSIRIAIARGILTLSGWSLIIFSLSSISSFLELEFRYFLIIFGIGLIYLAWISLINNSFIQFGHFIWNTGRAIKQAFVDTLSYIWSIRENIVRGIMTVVGILASTFAVISPSLGPWIQPLVFGCGIIIFYLAWRIPINAFFVSLASSINKELKSFLRYLQDLGKAIKDNVIAFGHYLWLIRIAILRAGMTIAGPVFIFFGLFYPSLDIILRGGFFGAGIVIFYIPWRTPINDFVVKLVSTIIDGLKAFVRFFIDIGNSIKASVIAFGKYLWLYRLSILRAGMSIAGPISIFYGIFTPTLGLAGQVLLSLLGIGLIYAAWRKEINQLIIQTILAIRDAFISFLRFLWDTGSAIKRAIYDFFVYVWKIREAIFRAVMTVTGIILIVTSVYSVNPIVILGLNFFLILGFLLLYLVWYPQVHSFINQTVKAIGSTFISFGNFIREVVGAIKEGIINYFHYIWSLRYTIRKMAVTITGVILELIGLAVLLSNGEIWIYLPCLIFGSIFLIAAWSEEIRKMVDLTIQAILKAIGAIISFSSRIAEQLLNLFGAILDSIIYIAIVTLGVTAFGYGVILVVSGLLDDKGAWTKTVIYPIPLIGDILWLFASILQGIPVREVENLIGIFANDPVIVLLLLGLIFIIVGVVIPFITYFSRDSLKISNLQKRFGDSSTEEGDRIQKGGK